VSAPDGLLLVDKPSGITSHDVVDRVRCALGTRKVGHAGTLDPMATGLMLVGAGRATRLLRYLSGLDKTYEGTCRLGQETDTYDAEGEVVASCDAEIGPAQLEDAIGSFVGEIEQRPPAHSAVRVGGRRLYEAARRGEAVEAPPRVVRIYSLKVTAFDGPNVDFRVSCSSGTYVRSLVHDLGRTLRCGAHLARLVRTRVGPFALEDARPLEDPGQLLPIERAVAHLPRVDLDEDEARGARNGQPLAPAGIDGAYGVFGPDGSLIGVYRDGPTAARAEMILPPLPRGLG